MPNETQTPSKEVNNDGSSETAVSRADDTSFDEHCDDCKLPEIDPKPENLVMYLHAWKNKVGHSVAFS